MAAVLIRSALVASCVLLMNTGCKGGKESTELSVTVASLNEKLKAYPFGEARSCFSLILVILSEIRLQILLA